MENVVLDYVTYLLARDRVRRQFDYPADLILSGSGAAPARRIIRAWRTGVAKALRRTAEWLEPARPAAPAVDNVHRAGGDAACRG